MTTIAPSSSSVPIPSTSTTTNTNTNGLDSETLKAAIFQRLHPRVYLERFLAENVRPDGRGLGFIDNRKQEEELELDNGIWRDVSINVGSINTADGSALVRMGGTTIVCGVKAEIAEPDLESPDQGFLVPNVDLPAMCHPKFKPGPPSDEAQVLSERLYEVLTTSNFISQKSLVIHPSKSVWTLYVDATCINYDGNVFDATLLAMVAALLNTKLPKAVYNEDTNQTTCYKSEKMSLEIEKMNLPVGMSFGLFDSKNVLADPTAFEEPLLESTLSIITNRNQELLSLVQHGLGCVNATSTSTSTSGNGNGNADDVISGCIVAAKKRSEELVRIIDDAV